MATPLESKLAALDRAAQALTEAEGILGAKPPTPTRIANIALIRKARAQVLKARSALSTAAGAAFLAPSESPAVAKSASVADGGVSSAFAMLQHDRPWRAGPVVKTARTNAPSPTVAKAAPPDDVQSDGADRALATLRQTRPWRGGRP